MHIGAPRRNPFFGLRVAYFHLGMAYFHLGMAYFHPIVEKLPVSALGAPSPSRGAAAPRTPRIPSPQPPHTPPPRVGKVRRKVTKPSFWGLETMGPIKHPTISLFIYATMQNLSSHGWFFDFFLSEKRLTFFFAKHSGFLAFHEKV